MKLYLLNQIQNRGYDTYDACIVAAENEDAARLITPCPREWGDEFSTWASEPKYVEVEYLGEAVEGTETGVILSSFNAG